MDTTVILVEGESDKAALAAVAARRGLDLEEANVVIVVMNGASNVVRFLTKAVAKGARVGGLYDIGEQAHIVRALAEADVTQGRDPGSLEQNGFFVCDPDLEGELIRAAGVEQILQLVAGEGEDARRFDRLQQMPEWRGRPVEDQLRRWFGSGGSRKIRYARLLVDVCSLERMPPPLVHVLDYAVQGR